MVRYIEFLSKKGTKSMFKFQVLACIAPWLKESLAVEESIIILPDISGADFRTFGQNLMQDKDYFHIDEVKDLRLSVASVTPILNISHFDDLMVSKEDSPMLHVLDQSGGDDVVGSGQMLEGTN